MKHKLDLTVILTVWKREYLEEQLEHIYAQTVEPANIWVVQCCEHVSVKPVLKRYPAVKYIRSGVDLKYFSRFSIGIHANTKYTWVLDDDIMPSPSWIETCTRVCEKYEAIVCSNGRIIPAGDFTPEIVKDAAYLDKYFIGDSRSSDSVNLCSSDTVIDFGCSSYFFKTEWLKYFWEIWPCTLETSEDMHLSATCKILGNISTVVPRQCSPSDSGNVKPTYSYDEHASWTKAGFFDKRPDVLKYLIRENNWRPLLWSSADCAAESFTAVPGQLA